MGLMNTLPFTLKTGFVCNNNEDTMSNREITDKDLIEKYVSMRDLIAVKKKAFEEITKPYKAGMDTIEQALLARLVERGADNTKTDAGTAYKVEHVNVKVVDREKFVEFIMQEWETIGNEMLLAAPQKDAVRQYVDSNGRSPPGIEVSYFTDVNVRKS